MPPLLLKLVFDRLESGPVPFFVQPVVREIARRVKRDFVEPQLATHLAFMEGALAKSPWFAGQEFTAADIQMSFPVEAAQGRAGLTQQTSPRLSAYLERIRARPAYQRAIVRGGPFSI
jgi:glutathione S-transferase